MPRRFEAISDEDRIIYDEEQEVEEMYFVSKGIVGIGFSLIATSCTRNHIIAKEIKGAQIIGDHYTVNDQKSQFIYMAIKRDVCAFALSKMFLLNDIFPKYDDIRKTL